MEITNTAQLTTYLEQKKVDFSRAPLKSLTGGSANFVWRMIDASGRPVIVKHAEPYIAASNARTPFPVERMDFEHRILKHMTATNLDTSAPVTSPECYEYDPENHILMMQEGGPRTLKEAYTDTSLDIQQIGTEIGQWLAKFHQKTLGLEIENNKVARAIYRFSYSNLATTLSQYGLDPSVGEVVDSQYGSLLATDNEYMCHGDFWPGNILVNGQRLTVVDWEMVRRGCGATDVGQFAAEAWLLDRFRGGRGLLPAFLSGYQTTASQEGPSTGKADKQMTEFFRRVAIQMGTHLSFWPTRVLWGSQDETQDAVKQGFEVLVHVLDNNYEWFEGSFLKELL